jgi:hypothetical protein
VHALHAIFDVATGGAGGGCVSEKGLLLPLLALECTLEDEPHTAQTFDELLLLTNVQAGQDQNDFVCSTGALKLVELEELEELEELDAEDDEDEPMPVLRGGGTGSAQS